MAIDVTCPAGHSFKVKQAYAGRSGRCPQCGETVLVPAEATMRAIGASSAEEKAGTPGSGSELLVAAVELAASQSDPSSARPAVKRLGRFELVEVVGTGGFGTVYRARDPQLDRDVALKVPRSGALADDDDANRFLREAKASAQLRHPNIVAVYEAGQIDGTYYIAAGFVEGTTLRQAIKDRGAFPQREAATLVAKLAAALHYAHGKGIVHRDVKPANAMLDAAGEPLIMDFGLARRDEGDASRTMEGMILGTPAYMSPEQAQGRGHQADARSDLWSLGVILYELLTGQKPFSGGDTDVMIAVRVRDPDPPRKLDRTIPRDLETICLKCLAKSPAGRYATCQELADELERWLRGDPILARRINPVERFGRWARRNPAVAGLIALTAVLLVTVAVVQSASIVLLTKSQIQTQLALAEARKQAIEAERLAKEARIQTERAEDFALRQKTALDQLRSEETARRRAEAKAAAAARLQARANRDSETANSARVQAEKATAELAAAKSAAEKSADDAMQARKRAEVDRAKALEVSGGLLGYIERLNIAYRLIQDRTNAKALEVLEECPNQHRSWEWSYLKLCAQQPAVIVRAASRDGITAIDFNTRGDLALLSGSGSVSLIDPRTGELRSQVEVEDRPLRAFLDDESGDLLALVKHRYESRFVRHVSDSNKLIVKLSIDNRPIHDFVIPYGQPMLITRSSTGFVKVVDARTLKVVSTQRARQRTYEFPIMISPDLHTVASNEGGVIRFTDAATGAGREVRFTPVRTRKSAYAWVPDACGFSPNSQEFAVTACGEAAVWNVATGARIPWNPESHRWLANAAPGAISMDGRRAFNIQGANTITVWDLESGRDLVELDFPVSGIQCASFSPDGQRALIGCAGGMLLVVGGEGQRMD